MAIQLLRWLKATTNQRLPKKFFQPRMIVKKNLSKILPEVYTVLLTVEVLIEQSLLQSSHKVKEIHLSGKLKAKFYDNQWLGEERVWISYYFFFGKFRSLKLNIQTTGVEIKINHTDSRFIKKRQNKKTTLILRSTFSGSLFHNCSDWKLTSSPVNTPC